MPKSIVKYIFCIILVCACKGIIGLQKNKIVIFTKTLKFTNKNDCWLSDDLCVLNLPTLDQDKEYNIILEIIYNTDYIFHNIHIEYSLSTSSELIVKDTKDLNLFDESNGRPLGSKLFSKALSMDFILLNNYKPTSSKAHTLTVQQFMRTKSLKGIESITIEISTNTK